MYNMRLVSVDTTTGIVRIRAWGAYCISNFCSQCGAWERWVCIAHHLKGPDGAFFREVARVYPKVRQVYLVTQLDADYYDVKLRDDPLITYIPDDKFPSLKGAPLYIQKDPHLESLLQYYMYHPFVHCKTCSNKSFGVLVYFLAGVDSKNNTSSRRFMYKGGKYVTSWDDLLPLAAESNIDLRRIVDCFSSGESGVIWNLKETHRNLLAKKKREASCALRRIGP